MHFLNHEYYLGILNAAAFYCAAHQQLQEFYEVTTKPFLLPVKNKKIKINFFHKKQLSVQDLIDRKTDTGFIKLSSAELTAFDLIHIFDRVGGMNRVATVLQELTENLDGEKLVIVAKR